jgi:small subunit ribosomal protein S9
VTPAQRVAAKTPLGIPDINETFDIFSTVKGGGVNGQADAIKLGIARALMEFNIELRKALKAGGMVTRDARGKERKKYGQKGARARFQFSKR